jgi:hypothetical protein
LRTTRRGLQLALAALWLLDAALQFQPYMFTRAFAYDSISPAADGQPGFVAAPVHFASHLIAAHPIAMNAAFALVQLALAAGLVVRRTSRLALVASLGWSASVWWLGEGLGGLATGHAMLLTGAPGAVLLYAVIALAALPRDTVDGRGEAPGSGAVVGWVAVWAVGAVFQTLPGQNSAGDIAASLRDDADNVPGWLAHPTRLLASNIDHHAAVVVALIALPLLIAAAAVVPGAPRIAAATAGGLLAAGFWVFGQGFGLLFSGESTDPNTGPLLILLAFATAAAVGRRAPAPVAADDRPRSDSVAAASRALRPAAAQR